MKNRAQILTIFRGLPGSGKSTEAHKLAKETGAMLIEPDALCTRGGEYLWDEKRWGFAVAMSKTALGLYSSILPSDLIYADVLPSLKDVHELIGRLGSKYEIRVIDCKLTEEESLKRNRHNVNPEHIKRMARDWEDWENE